MNRLKNIFFIIGVLAVVIMIFSFDVSFRELWNYCTQAGGWLIAILALWGVLYLLNTLAWQTIIKGSGDCPVSFLRLFKYTLSGFALNYTTPVGLLGGEPYKIMEMTKHIGVQRATSSVVLFAMMHVFAHFSYWTTSIPVYIILALMGYLSLNTGTSIVLFLMTIFCAFGMYLFSRGYKYGIVVKFILILCKIPGLRRWALKLKKEKFDDLQKIDKQIAQLHGQNTKTFYLSFLIEYAGRMLQSLEIMFMLILFMPVADSVVPENLIPSSPLILFLYSFLILSFTSLFANLLSFLPLQLGGREGGFAISVSQMGMTSAIGLFVSIICRVREIFWAAIGLILMKIK